VPIAQCWKRLSPCSGVLRERWGRGDHPPAERSRTVDLTSGRVQRWTDAADRKSQRRMSAGFTRERSHEASTAPSRVRANRLRKASVLRRCFDRKPVEASISTGDPCPEQLLSLLAVPAGPRQRSHLPSLLFGHCRRPHSSARPWHFRPGSNRQLDRRR
jgi:hypothetical protein